MGNERETDTTTTTATADRRHGCQGWPDPNGHTSAEIKPLTDIECVRFDALRSIRYHEAREIWFVQLHRITMFIVVLLGGAAFATLGENSWFLGQLFALAAPLAGTFDLVCDWAGQARRHGALRQAFFSVYAATERPDADTIALRHDLARICADEPPTMHIVDSVAYNAVNRSMGRDPLDMIKITWGKYWLMHIRPYNGFAAETYRETGETPFLGK